MRRRPLLLAVLLTLVSAADGADAPDVVRARELYSQGITLVRDAQWGEALSLFEQSAALRPHPITIYNIGVCERALGRYTRAARSFERALSPGLDGMALPASMAAEAATLRDEVQRLLVRAEVTVAPADAVLLVDGRPVQRDGGVFLAGVRPAGAGEPLPAGRGTVELDPGAHVFVVTRRGFADVVVNRSFAPGARTSVSLELDRLPATIRVSASRPGAVVSVGGLDAGVAPVELARPAGAYTILVRKPGFDAYRAEVTVAAGEETAIAAHLVETKVPLTRRWWFWAGAAGVVAGGVTATYLLTRQRPEPAPYDGGSTGWVVR